MATLSKVDSWVEGNKRVRVYDVTFSSSYSTGGEAIAPTQVGLRKIILAEPIGAAMSSTPTTYQVQYDYTNQKLLAFAQNSTPGPAVAQPQVANATNLSAFTVRMRFLGY